MLLSKISYWNLLIGLLFLVSCQTVWHTARVNPQNEQVISDSISADIAVSAMIQPYQDQLKAEMNQVIGQVAMEMKKQRPESRLGNWVADLCQEQAIQYGYQPDCAVANYGGLRVPSIAAGPLTKGMVFELMPFDNILVIVELEQEQMQQLCDHMARNGGWPISEQLRFTIEGDKAVDIQVNAAPLSPTKTYKVLLPDYIANGGDKCDFLRDRPQRSLNILTRQAILDYVAAQTKAGKTLSAEVDGRISPK